MNAHFSISRCLEAPLVDRGKSWSRPPWSRRATIRARPRRKRSASWLTAPESRINRRRSTRLSIRVARDALRQRDTGVAIAGSGRADLGRQCGGVPPAGGLSLLATHFVAHGGACGEGRIR
jgi:hypothetical protein